MCGRVFLLSVRGPSSWVELLICFARLHYAEGGCDDVGPVASLAHDLCCEGFGTCVTTIEPFVHFE